MKDIGFEKLSDQQIEELRYYITPEQPFGPENARLVKLPYVRTILFNKHNMLCREYRQNPRIIIGRRGSGKTALITNTGILDVHTHVLSLHPEEVINTVKSIIYPDDSSENQFVESIAKVWKVTLNSMLMAKICKESELQDLPRARAYLATCDIPVDSAVSGVMGSFRKRAEDLKSGVPSFLINTFLDSLNVGTADYGTARDEIDCFLEKTGRTAVIIIDSLDDYFLNDEKNQQVMAGLLKCVGEYGNRKRHIRLCIPGEAYFDIRRCSSNPLKDFTKNLLLHWLPSEIYGVIAWRYLLYCRLYEPNRYQKLRDLNLMNREDSLVAVSNFLPERVVNKLRTEEPTLPYIMRHSQFLPRQIIVILNKIFGYVGANGNELTVPDSNTISSSLEKTEGVLCEEIFSAFKYKYPNAYAFCESCVPELARVFDNGRLQQVFTRHGKGVAKSLGDPLDYAGFKKMLIELGVVGRVRDKTELYAEAEFEYAQPGRLNLSVDDQLCLHPIFSGAFGSSKNNGEGLFVYPQKEWFDDERGRYLRVQAGDR